MLRSRAGIRNAGLGAVFALMVTCVLVPAASGQQSSGGDAPTKKSASATKASTNKASTSKRAPAKRTGSTRTASVGSKKSSGTAHSISAKRGSRKKSARSRGQQKIDSERAQSIQEALIREHYLSGEATGAWNQASEEAMRRYQADNGWQSKTVPDSRALIKLGLGPSKDHLLNPESAMTTMPGAPRSYPVSTASHTSPATANPPSTAAQGDSSVPQ